MEHSVHVLILLLVASLGGMQAFQVSRPLSKHSMGCYTVKAGEGVSSCHSPSLTSLISLQQHTLMKMAATIDLEPKPQRKQNTPNLIPTIDNRIVSNQHSQPKIPRNPYSIYAERGSVKFTAPQNGDCSLLEGIEDSAIFEKADEGEGVFISFKFPSQASAFDVRLGKLPSAGKYLAHSRIKRWWMAPNFQTNTDSIPVETQSLLIEIDEFKRLRQSLKVERMSDNLASGLISAVSRSKTALLKDTKTYAVIIPLIDYDRGFRVTLFGKEGGQPAGDGVLAARLESGDSSVIASDVSNAVYVAAGSDPYQLMNDAYASIARRMGTFRTRNEKTVPQWANLFGFCTWDAFYSSVDSEKVQQGVESLIDAGAPPGFVIIDDGWQSTGPASRPKKKSKTQQAQKSTQPKATVIDDVISGEPVPVIVSEQRENEMVVGLDATLAVASNTMSQYDSADGELSGAQIDGDVAAQQVSKIETNPILALLSKAFLKFYSECVEKGGPNSWAVKIWRTLARTVLKEKLIDFFEFQTDFSKRLTSWKANVKFEDASKGKSLKSFVRQLKGGLGVKYVHVWHALSGYWGGVSEDQSHDWSKELNEEADGYIADTDLSTAHVSDIVDRPTALEFGVPSNYTGSVISAASQIVGRAVNTPLKSSVQLTYAKPTPHLLLVEPALAWDPSALAGVGSVAIDRLEKMYMKMHSYLADAGIDGVKVDAQSGIGVFGEGRGGGAHLARACVSAMETSVKSAFGKSSRIPILDSLSLETAKSLAGLSGAALMDNPSSDLISEVMNAEVLAENRPRVEDKNAASAQMGLTGCMCHSTENLFSFRETSTIRASDDFYPKDEAAQTVHLVSCAYNSVMLGEIGVCDWDMFHSVHPYAEVHAAARAISGGPVYVSDAPGKHDPELLRRLILANGDVLRAQLPARPTADCLFEDVMSDGKTALKLWTLNAHGAVAAVFNVQGASWDRKQRKYAINTELRKRSLDARLSPRDIGLNYFDRQSLLEPSKGDQMVIAWSAKDRAATLLDSPDDTLSYQLEPKSWDVVSLFKVRAASTLEKRTHTWGKFADEVSRKIGLTRSDPDMQATQSYIHTNASRDGVVESNTELYINHFGDSRIYWAPIGLLNMFNAGGAIVAVTEPSSTIPAPSIPQLTSISNAVPPKNIKQNNKHAAEFKVKGTGDVGFYASKQPAHVQINGLPVQTTWTSNGCKAGGIVSIHIPEDSEFVGAAKRLVQEALEPITSTLGDPLELTSPLEDINTISVYWE